MHRGHLPLGRTQAQIVLLLGTALTLVAAPASAHAAAAPVAVQASECTVPNVLNMQVNAAALTVALAGFTDIDVDSSDPGHDIVVAISPSVGTKVACSTTVVIEGEACEVSVPWVEGLKLKPAMDRIAAYHLVPKLNSSGANWVMRQNPPGGTTVRCYTKVYLTPGPPGTDPP